MVNRESTAQECDPSPSFPMNIGTTQLLSGDENDEWSVATVAEKTSKRWLHKIKSKI
jgi:hypothetical protein